MATQELYLKGTSSWISEDKKYNRNTIDVYLDSDSDAKLQESGSQTSVRQDDDDKNFYRFARPFTRETKKGVEELGPPDYIDVNGAAIDPKVIGHGSEVTVKVYVYDTSKGKGTRLEAVRVDKLVERENTFIEDTTEQSPF